MNSNFSVLAQEQVNTGNPILNIAIFLLFIVGTLTIVVRATRQTSQKGSDFYTGGASFNGWQNGLAIAGDYLSAAAFLGVTGAIALYGYDGFLYSVGFLIALLVALVLVAEPLRNTGRFTMADVLSFRLQQRPVRTAAAISTLTISLFYLIAQMAGAGGLVALLLGIQGKAAQNIVVAVVGVLMIVYVLLGGMKGTTYVQMIKAVLLVGGSLIIALLTFWAIKGGFNATLEAAVANHPSGEEILGPGMRYGATTLTKIDFVSLGMALVFGTAGLPHVLMRFYTVPTAREARRSVTWTIAIVALFFLLTVVMGYGAAALVGPDTIKAAPGGVNSAVLLLSAEVGGPIFMAVISAIAFATILAVVAGLAITASASVAHDIYNSVIRNGEATEEEQVRVSRITVVVIGVLAIVLGIGAMGQNIAFLVALAFGIAGAANLPTIIYSLNWKRFNTTGALCSIYGGLIISLVLITFSPAVSGAPTAMFPNADFAWFPLTNPAIVAIPAGFLLGIIGTLIGKPDNLPKKAAEMEVRSLTGVGVEKAVSH
ncbi:cation acetate symporter [Corynebacterium sp. 153RC1]|uniref:solute symporter family protein n=1 Tax=unclassified Corynebacterium TaxID=2624378 RepID=UPI00211CB5E8|nr:MULTISPECIES: cation acetate symporter [unclassified Corynebacterium]MCQ9371700.1 cation acetate symporter [Corynebacterium sp. 35RC1]MCQ9353441.1 cation acetate symporter [Corynebacterium sp. 209RC1]MCQ9355543.1 cation acetate symporter [Corynebacterium sp. 1222RC1]MCQ9357680.1 cation acetate symporter [Corynebacterium sp. 122RC1]MCQ9359887.1 cation acetate symporter [Corynebacterium sp. 142RC1]